MAFVDSPGRFVPSSVNPVTGYPIFAKANIPEIMGAAQSYEEELVVVAAWVARLKAQCEEMLDDINALKQEVADALNDLLATVSEWQEIISGFQAEWTQFQNELRSEWLSFKSTITNQITALTAKIPKTVTLIGDVTGTGTFDANGNMSIATVSPVEGITDLVSDTGNGIAWPVTPPAGFSCNATYIPLFSATNSAGVDVHTGTLHIELICTADTVVNGSATMAVNTPAGSTVKFPGGGYRFAAPWAGAQSIMVAGSTPIPYIEMVRDVSSGSGLVIRLGNAYMANIGNTAVDNQIFIADIPLTYTS